MSCKTKAYWLGFFSKFAQATNMGSVNAGLTPAEGNVPAVSKKPSTINATAGTQAPQDPTNDVFRGYGK